MQFKQGQEQIINMGVDFLRHSNNQVFEYDGEAGTGKSVVLMEILRRAGYKQNEILPMAYTGQAAIVMRTKGFQNAVTLHSGLFKIEQRAKINDGKVLMDTQFNAPALSDVFVVKDNLSPDIKVIAIDEGFLVPFEMKEKIEKFGLKIIVTGDSGQLPPIMSKPAYLYDSSIPHLTELMRQNEGDGIVYLARRARRGLPIHCGRYGNAIVIEEDELTDDIICSSDIVLCGTNKKREELNHYIRAGLLNIHDTLPVHGERMICRKNNWNAEIDGISLANGLVGTVTSPPSVSSFNGREFQMDFMPDLLDQSFHNVTCDYKYLIGNVDERRKIKASKFSAGEKFEYAYASTTHLAQGAEYRGGIYFEEYMGRDIQDNLNYSGATRFKQWLCYVKKKRRYF